ncbi:MAG: site-specific DNA-methyltransferase [Oscillospiraceae bacterium]|nr:site-specific DNA-methyltransferase [Oscillospiraceae bacterium]
MSYTVIHADCFEWMACREEYSITAIVTDPPYGVKEYTESEMEKRRQKKGGIWRIPPSFDGHARNPLPRFSVINDDPCERQNVYDFFYHWAKLVIRLLVPGGHVFIASTPLLSDIVSRAMREAGFERRGEIIRTVSTLRGGDRPKGAESEFSELSVIPRGLWEPWGLYRKPLSEKTVAENLRRWKAGALRRDTNSLPFCDLIPSGKTPRLERQIAPHPSVKPQEFLRKLVYASLPFGTGTVLDPFSGSGSTLAAAEFWGYDSVGIEKDAFFFQLSQSAIPQLAKLYPQTVSLSG